MLLIMGINLFTSRVILEVIGIDDFGIYNVVSGIVILFSFLNTVMSTATQRFLSFDLGRNDIAHLKSTFSVSMSIHIGLSFIILLLCETIGVYLINYQMDIPFSRINAANWVFQISIINCCLKFIRVPYNACIIAYERMSFFAYIGFFEVVLGLVSVYLLYLFIDYDLLVLYALFLCISTFIILIWYKMYCNKILNVGFFAFIWDKTLFRSITFFSSWSLLGGMANMGSQQGINIILNIFCGVVVNAAMGIATQVSIGVYSLVSSFQTAFVPQLVKLYAQNNHDEFIKLIIRTSKFSFYLIFVFAFPVILNIKYLLELWLVDVPEYTAIFCQLMIVFCCIDALSSPLWNSIQATGRIKKYQIIISTTILLSLPIAYVLLKCGFSPVYILLAKVLVNILVHFIRIYLLRRMIVLPARLYLYQTLYLPIVVILLSVPIPTIIYMYSNGIIQLILSSFMAIIIVSILTLIIGCSKEERIFVFQLLKNKLRHG